MREPGHALFVSRVSQPLLPKPALKKREEKEADTHRPLETPFLREDTASGAGVTARLMRDTKTQKK